jgi:hypothetical protein
MKVVYWLQEVMGQTVHQLEWQQSTLLDIMNKEHSAEPSSGANNSGMFSIPYPV